MKRLLALAALALLAGQADAQLIKLGTGDAKKKSKSGNEPPPLGPWYNYWPLEAHFQAPAMPEYPFYSAPQTVPVVPPAPYQTNGMGAMGHPGLAPYGGGFGGYPGMMPYVNGMGAGPGAAAPTAAPMPTGAMGQPGMASPYPALSGYPGYGGYPMPMHPMMSPYPGMAPQRR
jgi:hypothetical protein